MLPVVPKSYDLLGSLIRHHFASTSFQTVTCSRNFRFVHDPIQQRFLGRHFFLVILPFDIRLQTQLCQVPRPRNPLQ